MLTPNTSVTAAKQILGAPGAAWRWVRYHRGIQLALGALALMLFWLILDDSGQAWGRAPDCDVPAVPDHAGSGMPGLFDKKPDSYEYSDGNTYGKYGWSGLNFYQCGQGAIGSYSPLIELDQFLGNLLMGIAVWTGSIITGLTRWVADPANLLGPIDDRIEQFSAATRGILVDNWFTVALIAGGIFILLYAITKKAKETLLLLATSGIAMVFISLVGTYPLTIAKSMDGVETAIISQADQKTLEIAGIPNADKGEKDGVKDGHNFSAKPWESTGAVLKDQVVMPFWRMGAVGEAKWSKNRDKFYKAGTLSWKEQALSSKDKKKKDLDHDSKNRARASAAKALAKPEIGNCTRNGCDKSKTYRVIKGDYVGTRSAAGVMAAAVMIIVALIRIPALILIILGALVMRMVPIIGPLFAVIAPIPAFRKASTAGLQIVLASIYNVAVYGVLASIHTAFVAILFNGQQNMFVSLLVLIAVTVLFWKVAKPFRSVTRLATGKAVAEGLTGSGALGNFIRGVGASYLGNKWANNSGDQDGEGEPDDPEGQGTPRRQRRKDRIQTVDAPAALPAALPASTPPLALPSGTGQQQPQNTAAHEQSPSNHEQATQLDGQEPRLALPAGMEHMDSEERHEVVEGVIVDDNDHYDGGLIGDEHGGNVIFMPEHEPVPVDVDVDVDRDGVAPIYGADGWSDDNSGDESGSAPIILDERGGKGEFTPYDAPTRIESEIVHGDVVNSVFVAPDHADSNTDDPGTVVIPEGSNSGI